jgi:hypothetical protein
MTTKQYKKMDALGIIETLEPENVTPDLEFAIARGIALIHELNGLHGPIPAEMA